MASSLTRSSISFRRQGSSGIVWRECWIPGETEGSGSSALAVNKNDDAAADAVLSENMGNLPESSKNQYLLHSGSLESNTTAYGYEGHRFLRREITDIDAPKKTNIRFTRWVKRAFSKSRSAKP